MRRFNSPGAARMTQVIGRALRRESYELNEEGPNRGLFNVEYADHFCIRHWAESLIPHGLDRKGLICDLGSHSLQNPGLTEISRTVLSSLRACERFDLHLNASQAALDLRQYLHRHLVE